MKYTYQDVKRIVESAGYVLLSREEEIVSDKGFVTTTTYIMVDCPICEHLPYEVKFSKFKGSEKVKPQRCKKCTDNAQKISEEEVKEHVENQGYEMLNSYTNCKKKIKLKHKECGCIYDVSYDHFKRGSRCPLCNGGRKYTLEDIKTYVENYGWSLISKEYVNSYEKIHLKCPNGHDKHISFSEFRIEEKRSCRGCFNDKMLDNFKKYIEELGYVYIGGKYENSSSIFKLKCQQNHIFDISYHGVKHAKNGCPCCRESKGEREIRRVLTENNVNFIKEYKTNDCKFKTSLPFDFYLPDLNVFIEYDGEYHYHIIEFYGGLDKFISRKINDTIKTEYCKRNNLKLIRIPYWEKNNIEKILKEELNLR